MNGTGPAARRTRAAGPFSGWQASGEVGPGVADLAGGVGQSGAGIEAVPWGARMMTVADPFGSGLRFNQYQ